MRTSRALSCGNAVPSTSPANCTSALYDPLGSAHPAPPAGLTRDAAEALVWSGACDSLAPRMERRQRLWQLRELWPLVDPHPKGGEATS